MCATRKGTGSDIRLVPAELAVIHAATLRLKIGAQDERVMVQCVDAKGAAAYDERPAKFVVDRIASAREINYSTDTKIGLESP